MHNFYKLEHLDFSGVLKYQDNKKLFGDPNLDAIKKLVKNFSVLSSLKEVYFDDTCI